MLSSVLHETVELCSCSSTHGRPLVAAEGELIIRRRGEPIARVLPMTQQRRPPDHADLRQRMPLLKTLSADLIRNERDERSAG